MSRRKFCCVKWTLMLVLLFSAAESRPQESVSVTVDTVDKQTESPTRNASTMLIEATSSLPPSTLAPVISTVIADTAREVNKKHAIGDSIQLVASQLSDTRIPPRLKNQINNKHKINTRLEDSEEYSHAGVAVPITLDEIEGEITPSASPVETSSSTSGISTWILLSNPTANETSSTTEATKLEEPQKKKPSTNKNKTKRPQPSNGSKPSKRPIIASANKSDLVAGGSAINDNVLNKIKDTVLSNVQKNKNTSTQKATSVTTTTTTATEITAKKEEVTKLSTTVTPAVKVTAKPSKKKNKNKPKISSSTTTVEPVINESALLPMEAKEQEIELEISTPATTTKKPKRTSTKKKKKNKTKKHKVTSTKTDSTAISDVKTTEVKKTKKTKTSKPAKKPDNPITSQIFSYLSREVMPSVGVGVIGLAGLMGLAGYFLYPFAAPVRRTFEVDKKDDLYRHNAEEYGNEGNGQAEEEMLGTVLAGMPANSKHKLNPYIGQMAQANRYPAKKEQDLKYRHVASSYESPNYNVHYPQQKTGIAHGVVYSEPANYSPQQYETRHKYTTESKYNYDKSAYTPYPAVEPIYAAPQTGPSASGNNYGNEVANAVVYGVKPSAETDFKPVYPFEGQVFSETTSNPMNYSPTSMYLGSNNEAEPEEEKYVDEEQNNEPIDNKFVVGNVPKELSESATPAVVPEHGPRKLNRKKRGIVASIEEALKQAKANDKDIFISNEIDEALGENLKEKSPFILETITNPSITTIESKNDEMSTVFPVYPVVFSNHSDNKSNSDTSTTEDSKFIESVSTIPLGDSKYEKRETTTNIEDSNELDFTTKSFNIYEVFSSSSTIPDDKSSPLVKEYPNKDITTESQINVETTTVSKSQPTSPEVFETKQPETPSSSTPKPTTHNPNVITYPPINGEGSFFTFLKRLFEFKYRLGLSILQTTSDSLNRYLRNMDSAMQKIAKGSAA